MRKLENAYIDITNKLRVTNQDYARVVNDIAETPTLDVMTGVSLAIATMSYDLYLNKINENIINPKDYIDIRQDILLIAKEYISNISEALHLSYKDILSAVDEMVKLLIKPYDSSSVLFYNSIIDSTKNNPLNECSYRAEIIYKYMIKILDLDDKVEYNPESKYISNDMTDLVEDSIGV